MAGRIHRIEEKVQSVLTALDQINVEAVAREARVPPSTLRDDLKKVKKALPKVLADRKRGLEPENRQSRCSDRRMCAAGTHSKPSVGTPPRRSTGSRAKVAISEIAAARSAIQLA